MENFVPKERALNFTKVEKDRFQALVEKYKDVLFCKKTDNSSNSKKNRTWAAIHAEFSAGGDQPRTLRQLKAKFDNMKRNARKDACQERQARLRTGGGPPPPSVQLETDWFRSVMPLSMDGLPSVVDDDTIESQPTVSSLINNTEEIVDLITLPSTASVDEYKENSSVSKTMMDQQQKIFDCKSPSSLLRTPVSKPLRIHNKLRSTPHNFQERRLEAIKRTIELEENLYQVKMKHMEEKRQEEKELHELKKDIQQLKKDKLLLEISLLKK